MLQIQTAHNKTIYTILFLVVVLNFCMHFSHFSDELIGTHVWRQAQTQSTIINFYEEDMNIFNPRANIKSANDGIQRMEFPLMQWLTAGLYHITGNQLTVTRYFMFLIGVIAMFGLFHLLLALFNKPILSLIGAWAFTFSPAFYYYTINPLPDNLALCCGIWGLALFFKYVHNQKTIVLIASGLLMSLSALCKLPFILYYIVPVIYFIQIIRKQGNTFITLKTATLQLSWSLLPLVWYAIVIPQWSDNPVLAGVFDSRVSVLKLLDYLQHNVFITTPDLLLNYGSVLFFIAGFYFLVKRKSYRDFRFIPILWLGIMVIAYYLFEIIPIGKIHDYYLFPFYPLLFILVAYGAYHIFYGSNKKLRIVSYVLLIVLPLTCFLRADTRWNKNNPGFNRDLLTFKTELRNAVPKNAVVVAGNDISKVIFLYYIDKKGYPFLNNLLTTNDLQGFVSAGAEYLYSDSPDIIEQQQLSPFIDSLIVTCGSVKVYKLKNPI